MYSNIDVLYPFCISVNDSLLNVEKVLKPPQKPTAQNSLEWTDIICLLSAKPTIKPKAKHAIMFTTSVPYGK